MIPKAREPERPRGPRCMLKSVQVHHVLLMRQSTAVSVCVFLCVCVCVVFSFSLSLP